MRQRGHGTGLALEAVQRHAVTGAAKNLDRHVAIQARVARAIHISHPADPMSATMLYGPTRVPAAEP
jgi:hypothetical protein